ncbi:DNA phosphorothioation-associated putative methyltransferase [Vibrio parahaemolyticus]|uniref:DNA phosphorothioation-associated putative methyltransferase n=1 Tax=Vibrio parahaemolyticus TaxID=670 RepID=A0AAW8QDN0_VIBPH|nr:MULTISPECIES: DNA phosphorothioation-associated putative methyltransferase [Vibrio]MBE3700952.1 DNA phosphorothioation-associated putative methyltransferase [Vibrio parahaemolyticus]MBE3780241.1 DNA phosphorothioation-associated putative methyltransferase [Vibrio parahaemolyticus]MCZ6249794.1 DNA phosphorothioation-associated putative methyltransferase [Vibrio parahaemolyticus]MDE0552049.1 DNA phosphorothioation-associated putative methyltransferase [Vibrio sp. VP6]MDS1824398.1 DNA phosphor
MNEELFAKLVSDIKVGKQLPDAVYLHRDAFSALPNVMARFIPAVAKAVSLEEDNWNLVKLFRKEFRLSLLHYPDFYTHSYPALQQSLNVDLSKLSHKITSYEDSDNPPILHRKETMILPESEHYEHFQSLTQEGENAGLYENSRLIGFKRSWENLITRHGYELVDGRLFRSSAVIQLEDSGIDRHKTALVRHELSAPMKTLVKHGYLEGSHSIFDYGCGRGDDLRELEAHGLDALGWDPNFQPDNDRVSSDIVNLGFVLNVIEDQDERLEALLGAWDLSEKFLVVSVMLANESYIAQFKPYKDGVITSRNTFQKYYAQSEIKAYIERSLQEDAITVAPGIFYVFKDKLEEQQYLQSKYKRHHKWQQLTSPEPVESKDKAKLLITQNQELFNAFWNTCLELGRIPANDEFEQSDEARELIGSHKKVFSLLQEMFDTKEFEQAEKSRKEDLLLYFAVGLFEKRKPYTQQPESLKRDIKALFDDYKTAINLATELLFSIADTELINEQCAKAHTQLSASLMNEGHSLIFHRDYIDDLPLLLRVYVTAGLQMYGELDEEIDLIKIHITSGKLTLTAYDDFEKSVPFLVERIKIKMAEQDIDFFDYVDEERRPPLLNKHLLLTTADKNYEKQKSFDRRLSKLLGVSSDEEVIIHRQQFKEQLTVAGKRVSSYRLANL